MAKPGSFWPLWMHFPSKTAFLGGNDWGGRSACIIAALWPDRVRGLVSCGRGYNTQDIACAKEPAPAVEEARYRYMYYFHTERGRAGLTLNRRDICKHIWSIWSPTWRFDDATWAETAPSFDNPDFVDVVLHSYRIVLAASPGIPHMKISRPGLRNSQVSVCPASSCKEARDRQKRKAGCSVWARFCTPHNPYFADSTILAGASYPEVSSNRARKNDIAQYCKPSRLLGLINHAALMEKSYGEYRSISISQKAR